MRRVKVCSACGKPATVASTSCLWCGQPKRLFSGHIAATLKAAFLFMIGLMTRRSGLSGPKVRHDRQKKLPVHGTHTRGPKGAEPAGFILAGGRSRVWLSGLQVIRRRFSGPSIGDNLVRDFLTFVEGVHSGALDGADVNEHILAAVIRLDEAKALLAVEPLYGSDRHEMILSGTSLNGRTDARPA